MTVVSRLQLDHPTLGTAGGAGLHASIEAIYTKIGNNIADRILTAVNLNDASTATVTHNFKTPFANLRWDLYLYDETTTELDLITSSTSPSSSQFTIVANGTNPETQIDITNNSGAQRDLALVVFCDPINLTELKDVQITSPEDGQALVYNAATSKYILGASGDSSFKLQSIAVNVLTIKGGYLKLNDGRELATYNGSTYGSDITAALLTLFAAPVDGTTYWLYIDIDALGAEVTQGLTGRKLYAIQQAQLVLSATKPESINRARYVPLGSVVGEAGTTYENTNFTTYAAKSHSNSPLAINPKVYSLSQAVGSVGAASQIKAGHVLAAESFPSDIASNQYARYGFAAGSGADGNANTNPLDPIAAPAGATDIQATSGQATALNGTTQYFSKNTSFFQPASGVAFGVGVWAFKSSWVTAGSIFSQDFDGATNRAWACVLNTTEILFRITTSASTFTNNISIPLNTTLFPNNSWHHFAMTYDPSTLTMTGYIDGKAVGQTILSTTRAVPGSNFFAFGAKFSTAIDFFNGTLDEGFFANGYLLKDADIRKLYASKLAHGANVSAANQDWKFLLGSGVQKVPSISPVVDQTSSNTLYADFSDLDAAETVDVALLDMGMTAVAVPAVPPFDQTYTSNPSFPISHGLSEVPSLQVGYKDASNDWHWTTGEGAVKADSTQIKGSIQTYFDAAATHVRLRAVVGASPTGVKQATATTLGLVKNATDAAAVVKTDLTSPVNMTIDAGTGAAVGRWKKTNDTVFFYYKWQTITISATANFSFILPASIPRPLAVQYGQCTMFDNSGSVFLIQSIEVDQTGKVTVTKASGSFTGGTNTSYLYGQLSWPVD